MKGVISVPFPDFAVIFYGNLAKKLNKSEFHEESPKLNIHDSK